jgi:hypothetical protein
VRAWRLPGRIPKRLVGVLVLGIVFPVGSVLEIIGWPSKSFWETWVVGLVLLIAASYLAGAGGLVALQWKNDSVERQLEDAKNARILEQSALWLLIFVNEVTGLPLNSLSCSVWAIPSAEEPQTLKRVMHTPTPLDGPSGIAFTKGKGVVGRCWKEGRSFVGDLGGLRQCASKAAFYKIRAKDRYQLEWSDFDRTRKYEAIWPAQLRHEGSTRGFACVDSTDPQAYDLLTKALDDPAKTKVLAQAIRRVTEAFLRLHGGN